MVILSHTIPSRELASYNLPIVTIEREDQFVSSVNTDNYIGCGAGNQSACKDWSRYSDPYQC